MYVSLIICLTNWKSHMFHCEFMIHTTNSVNILIMMENTVKIVGILSLLATTEDIIDQNAVKN